jgi:hypothetical protein
MPEGNELLRFAAAKKHWGWKDTPPFRVEPPIDDARQLARLFTGRQAELSRVILPLYNGRNILVRGMLGVGKSAFILQVLHELDAQAKAAGEKILPIYIYHFYGGNTDDFYRLVLYALSGILADRDDEAKGVQDALRGLKVTASRSKGVSGKAGVHIFQVAEAKVGIEVGRETSREFTLENPHYFVDEFLKRAIKRFGRLVIAVDDLDKAQPENVRLIQMMLQGAMPLLRSDKCAFILTGLTLPLAHMAAFDLYGSMLGLFDEAIQLNVLSPDELRTIAIKTLSLVRRQERDDPYPFDEEAIAEAATRSNGIPRPFNVICARVLEQAALREIELIDRDAFAACYEAVQMGVSDEVTPQMRSVLAIASRTPGGFSPEMPDEALDELGFTTFVELMPLAEYLVANDLMIRQEYEGGVRYIVADLASRAASQGIILPEDGE